MFMKKSTLSGFSGIVTEDKMDSYDQLAEDYQRVAQAIRFLEQNTLRQPSLSEVAESVHLSEYHFQRLFTRWVGISPKRFLQFLTKEGAKQLLENSENLLDVAYEVGLSGPSRLHDLFIATEAVTPGEYKRQGEGLEIFYGFHASPFGECLLAITARGICHLGFVENGDQNRALEILRQNWAEARLAHDPVAVFPYIAKIFPLAKGEPARLPLVLKGTNFQIKVWEALLRIPPGAVTTYSDLAAAIGMPRAARAVGNAVASNPIPVLIPCHRVIRKAGDFGKYRYGATRKKALLGWERANSLR
jgi:AraC family transcriptional regulator of adaptative response/methylated-DNA-[protein]-cysteine methyltransferase